MKHIEFISPVAAIRGNMSGTQQLKYPLHDNRAFEGPDGSVNYARNYRPSYIGTKRASDGRCSFQTKRKSANHLTAKAKSAMANLGGVGAIYSALVRDKSAQVYLDALACYQDAVNAGFVGTFRKYMYGFIQSALDAKDATIDITTPNHHVSIDNPWVKDGEINISVNSNLIVKFWLELAQNPIVFNIGGRKGIAHVGNIFRDILVSPRMNVLNLAEDYVTIGDIEYNNCIFLDEDEATDVKVPSIGNSPVISDDIVQAINYDVLNGTREGG